MGRISKIILHETCDNLRIAININQWHSTNDCIKWFNNYDKNQNYSFIKYDIREFHPPINEKTVKEALKLAKEYLSISNDKIDIIMHCRKSLLHHNDTLWIKRVDSGNFDNTMGTYDSAELCELVGYFLLNNINEIIDPGNHGLYRDDGLMIVDKYTPRKKLFNTDVRNLS